MYAIKDEPYIYYQYNEKKEEALFVLNQYNDRAHEQRMKEKFQDAANVYYSKAYLKPFQVLLDDSDRLYFFCIECKKGMNNTKSLAEHAGSGSHLKKIAAASISNENDIGDDISIDRIVYNDDCYNDPNSLQCQLKTKNHILGLQMVEEYIRGRKVYYVCTFCNAHGKTSDMVKHLIGDKHTDKYIRHYLLLRNNNITADERTHLREDLFKRQQFTVNDIVTFRNPKLYPTTLENEGMKKRVNLGKLIGSRSPSPPSRAPTPGSSCEVVDMDIDDDSNGYPNRSNNNFRNPSPPIIMEPDVSVTKCSTSTQTLDYNLFQHILSNIEAFVSLQQDPTVAPLQTYEDVVLCLTLTFAVLHLIFFATKKLVQDYEKIKIPNKDEDKVPQIDTIKRCMGHIVQNLQPRIHAAFPEEPKLNLKNR